MYEKIETIFHPSFCTSFQPILFVFSKPKMPVKTDLPKRRSEMTEADWVHYNKTRYRTWYDTAGIIVFNSHGDVLVVQDAVTKKWSFPKGAAECQDQEEPLVTAIRECYEEVGLIPLVDYNWATYQNRDKFIQGKKIYFFATIEEGAEIRAHVNDEEGAQVAWCSIAHLQMLDCNLGIRMFCKHFHNK